MTRLPYLWLPCVLCLSMCVALDLFYFPGTTVFPDEQRFFDSATRLAVTGQFWVGSDRAWEMPGTALFFAPAIWLFGPQAALTPIRLVQAILVAVQCGLVAISARQMFGATRVGFIAACLAAAYPFFWFYQGLLLSETIFTTLLLGGFTALLWWRDRGLKTDFALVVACALFSAATLTKATLTVLPPLLFAATAWAAGTNLRRVARILFSSIFLYVAFLSPWWIRNAAVLHTFVPFTTSSGLNLYLGNNPNNMNAGIDWSHDVDPTVVARIRALPDEISRQHAFNNEAVEYIKNNPAVFFENAAKKFLRFWNIVPNASEYRTKLYSFISIASFGPILALALVCAVRWRSQWRMFVPLYLIIGYFTLLHIAVIASLRYRLPIEPLLIIMAAEPFSASLVWIRNTFLHRAS